MEAIAFQEFKSVADIADNFVSEELCVKQLENIRWTGDVVSPFDKTSKVYACSGGKYKCRNTGKYFTVRTHTIFHNTKVELVKWFQAIWLVSHSEKLTAVELSKQLDVTPKTAWLMQKRIAKFVKTKPVKNTAASELPLTDWLTQLK